MYLEEIRVAMAKTAGNEGTVEEATKILEAGGIEVPRQAAAALHDRPYRR